MKNRIFDFVQKGSWAFIIALLPVVTSCLNSDPVDPTPVSYVSIYHGSPNTGGLDITLNNSKINSSAFAYGNYSSYLSFPAGQNQLKFSNTGSTTALVEGAYTFEAYKTYSVYVVNQLSDIETLVVRDSSAALSTSGKASIRLIHLSPDAPVVDVYTKDNNSILFPSNAFKSASEFKEIDAKTYSFDIKTTDGTNLATVENLSIAEGRFYTLIVRGFVTPPAGNTNTITLQLLVNQ